jgi:hypothetical protein
MEFIVVAIVKETLLEVDRYIQEYYAFSLLPIT